MFVTDDKVIRSVAEPEQVEPKLFQIWNRSQNYPFNKYLLQSVRRILLYDEEKLISSFIGIVLLL